MKNLFSYFAVLGIFFSALSQAQIQYDTSSAAGAGTDIVLYPGQQGQIRAWRGLHYEWTPSSGLSSDTVAAPLVTATTTTTYVVKITVGSGFVYDTVNVFIITPGSGTAASCNNMVTNGDFEGYQCTMGYLSYWCCQFGIMSPYWQNANTNNSSSSDTYSALNGGATNNSCNAGAPYNGSGTELPHSGNTYMGVILHATSPPAAPNYYEYIQQSLPCSLLQYQRYGVSFWSAFADYSNYEGQSIGLLLTNGLPTVTNGQIVSSSAAITAYQGTTTAWTSHYAVVYGNNENWVTIGNFQTDPMNHIQSIGNNDYDYNYIDDVNITPLPPDINTLNSTNTACLGMGSVPTFTLQEQGSPAQYCDWYDYNGSYIGHGSPIYVTPPATAGTYSYTCVVTLPCVNCSPPLTSSITITVLPLTAGPTYTVTASPTQVCYGQSTVLTASGAPSGSTYVWNPLSGIYNGTQYSDIEHSDPNLAPGVYTYSISTTGCTGMGTVTFTVNPLPTFTINPVSPVVCTGQSNPTLTATNGSLSYTWAPTSSLTPPTSNTISVVAHPTVTTVYSATGTDGNGCQNVAQTTVTIQSPPTLTVTSNGPVCAGTNYTITATGVGSGGTYTISPSAVNQSVNGSGVGTFTITASPGTTYTINGASAGGCIGTATITPSVYSLPNVTVSASPSAICAGQTTTLTATGGASSSSSYTWTPSVGSVHTSTFVPSPSPTVTTSYTVTAQDNNGCKNTAVVTVTVNPLPSAPTVSPTLCANTANTLTVTNVPFPSPTYSWASPVGASTVTCVPSVVPACSQATITNPSGTYTVTATTAAGCSASTTVSTTALPSVAISTAPTSSICASSTPATFTLTASGASTYTWSTSATTSSITSTITTTTSYSVTGTASTGCKNTATATITVIATPTVNVSAGANPLCQGMNTTLTASGATNYTWTPSATLSSSSGAIVTASPTVTTTYTVTGTTYTCAPSSAVITLTVNTGGSMTVTPNYQSSCNFTAPGSGTICAGGTATLTASSGGTLTSYTWTPGPIVGASAVVSPTITTVYTVSGTGSTCSGSKTYTLTVSNCNCPGTALPVLTNTTIGSGSYATNSNTTYNVTGNVTLNATDVKMGANSIIHVQSGAYLQLRGAHLSSCYNMWQGIVVDPGGRVDVVNNSLIEDAIVAIDNGGTAGTVQSSTTSIPIIQVNGAIFNCNNTAIRKAFYQGGDDTKYGTSYFRVSDAVITCRCGIPFPVTTTTLTAYSNSGTVTPNPSTPDLLDYYSVANYTVAALKPTSFSHLGPGPFEGIHLEDLGLKQVPASTLTIMPFKSEIGVSGTGIVLFDNLTYGINATNATFSVTNTAYQNAAPIAVTLFHNTTYTGGYGIYAICNNPDWFVGLYTDHSWFNHLIRGIHSEDYYDFNINRNTLFSHISITPAGQSSTGAAYGSYGMYLYSTKFLKANMDYNTVADMSNGIIFSVGNTAGWVGTGNGQYVGPVSVTNNMLRDQFSGNSYTSKFIGVGISVSNAITPAITNTIAPAAGGATQISVSTNTVLNGFNGIAISNQQFQEVRDEHNQIQMLYQPTISSETNQYGIQHANNMYYYNTSTSPAGYGNDIYYNNITGITGGTVQATFEKKRGIWTRTSQNHYITCNTITGAGRAFDFEGTNSNIFWQQNIMTSNKEGYALSLTGVIGNQPTGGSTTSDNQWTSPGSGYADTYTDATSPPSSSKLYTRSTASYPYVPQANLSPLGTAYLGGSSLLTSSVVSTYTCQSPPAREANPSKQNQQLHQSGNTARASNASNDGTINYFELIVQDSVVYPMYLDQNTYINKNMVYRNLMRNPNLLDSSSVLADFLNNNSNSSWALFCQVEDSLYTGNYTYASTLLSSYTPSMSIEQNYKRFFEIFGNAMQGNRDSTDDADLAALASSCPMLNGTVVFQARALRNNLLKGYEDYEDNCPQDAARLVQSNITKSNSLLVYPNPTDGKVYVSGFAISDKVTAIEVLDITGKLVLRQSSPIKNGMIELNLNLNNGVYFIKVLSEGKQSQIEKVIISK